MELITIIGIILFVAIYSTDMGMILRGRNQSKVNNVLSSEEDNVLSEDGADDYESDNFNNNDSPEVDEIIQSNYLLMEYLAQEMKVFKKNYRSTPENYSSYNHFSEVTKCSETNGVKVVYPYPLPFGGRAIFKSTYKPASVSSILDGFGISKPSGPVKGFKGSEWDFPHILNVCKNSFVDIAEHIRATLISESKFDYKQTVETVRFFVNHIPYGIPKFNTSTSVFHELALAPEIMVLSYGDCDSKSVLMAGVLKELIDSENIILVRCMSIDPSKPGKRFPHKMVGISGMGYKKAQRLTHNSKEYHLIETTIPYPGDYNFNVTECEIFELG